MLPLTLSIILSTFSIWFTTINHAKEPIFLKRETIVLVRYFQLTVVFRNNRETNLLQNGMAKNDTHPPATVNVVGWEYIFVCYRFVVVITVRNVCQCDRIQRYATVCGTVTGTKRKNRKYYLYRNEKEMKGKTHNRNENKRTEMMRKEKWRTVAVLHKRLGRFSANLSKHFTVSISKNKEPRKKLNLT